MALRNQMTDTNEFFNDRKRRLQCERQNTFRKRHSTHIVEDIRHDLGRMDQLCLHCNAKFWMGEKDINSSQASPTFAVCCAGGKVKLPPLLIPPPYLMELYTSSGPEPNSFRRDIRAYNNLLAFTSFGANVNDEFQRRGVSNFTIHGQVYHLIGPLIPEEGQPPVFSQLYIYDTENETRNRLNIMSNLHRSKAVQPACHTGWSIFANQDLHMVK